MPISYDSIRAELKRLPSIRKRQIREDDLLGAMETGMVISTLEWILNTEDED